LGEWVSNRGAAGPEGTMTELPVLKIFLSSPGDVAEERALAEIVFRRLADRVAGAVRLEVILWEHEPLFAHADFMAQMPRPSQCDLVVIILWSRLGTRLPEDYAPEPGVTPPTGTEWEVKDALKAYAAMHKPSLLIYRKIPGPRVELGSVDYADRDQQWKKLDEFCRDAFYDAHGAVIVAHHVFSDSHEFERRLTDHVRGWLDEQIHTDSAAARPIWWGQSPFRGLESFEAEHQAIFFGRSEALSTLVRRIRDTESTPKAHPVTRLLLVQGMSGAGKTSLFKAGVLPLLDLRPVEGIAVWSVVSLRPSESDPAARDFGSLGALAGRLSARLPSIARLGGSVQKLAEELRGRPGEAVVRIETGVAADVALAGVPPEHARLLIYVDQLEEVFAQANVEAAAQLFGALVALARSRSVWVVATLRSDFVHRLEAFPDLMQCLAQSPPYTLMPPHPGELAEIIHEPARAAGLIWEQRDGVSLDQALLRDAAANPEALPLLEYTMAELYERREGRLLRWSEYGGALQGALISAANDAVTGTGDDVRTVFRDLMRELVGVGEDGVATRRYASLARFPDGSPARALLDRLVARRLCVTVDEGQGDGPVTRLAHEALVRAWPMAQEWLKHETLLLQIRDEVARDAVAWHHHGRKDDWLGVAPEKIAAIRQVEQAGLMPDDPAPQYARSSKQRAARIHLLRRAVVAAICLMALIAGIAWWLALNQRDLAQIRADTADRTTQFMVSLFQLADPTENRGRTVTVQEVLKKGADEITKADSNNGLNREPRVRAELLTAMGRAYSGLGLYKDAEGLLGQAVADERSASIPDDSHVRTLVAYGSALYLAGKYEEAEPPLRDAVALARQGLDQSSALRSAALTGLADVLVQLGKYSEAEQLCQEALEADRKRRPQDAAVLSNSLSSLGSAYYYGGDLTAAEDPMREALALRKNTFGTQDTRTAESFNNLGVLLYDSGKYDEAMTDYQSALGIERKVYGTKHPEVATTLINIGRSALMAGHVDEAEEVLRQALSMAESFQGDTHDYLVSPLNSLAMIDTYQGRLDEARIEIQRAESIARLPDHGQFLDQVLLNEADLELASGNLERAAALLVESKVVLLEAHPASEPNAWRYAVWDAVNARLTAAKGDVSTAERALLAAQNIIRNRFGANGFYTLRVQREMQQLEKLGPRSTES
jgi:tetratricopeptide (TPR) repeat protein